MRGIRWVGAILAVGAVLAPAALAAPPPPLAHGQGDAGGFHDVLPPGTNGFDNALELLQFESTGARPAHNQDQLGMYRDLLYASPGLRAANLTRYYKDSRFGAALAGAGQPYHPGGRDVTVVRDRYGVPHIRGTTRADTMYGIGYATAQDRLFFIDVLRHVGRAELSSFAGGAPANRLLDREIWQTAPYTEADLQRQVDQSPPGFAKPAVKLRADLHAYVDASTTNTKVSGPVKTPVPSGLLAFPQGMSNALLVSSRLSASGHPLAVFGPQVAYFAPEILMEQDIHGPGLDARGAAFPGANLYVSLGHGRDYAWSATSAGQDLTDTFAVPLCAPGGKKPSNDSMP